MIDNILAKKEVCLKKWNLLEMPPFRSTPPTDISELLQIFVNRENEVDNTILTLDQGENVLVMGMTGVGKTAFIMVTLHMIEEQSKCKDKPILPIHIQQFTGKTREDFYYSILYSLAKKLSHRNKRAKEILNALTGEEFSDKLSRSLSAGIEVQLPSLIKIKGEGQTGGEETKMLKIINPEYFVNELLSMTVGKRYSRIVIAIDDMESQTNQQAIKSMLEDSLDIIRDKRCSFMFTAKPMTTLDDINSTAAGLGLYAYPPITISPLVEEQLRMIAIKSLNLVRKEKNPDSVFPFTEEVINKLAHMSIGFPRQFLLLCGKMLNLAIRNDSIELTPDVFEKLFKQYQDQLAGIEIPKEIKSLLNLGLRNNGVISISNSQTMKEAFKTIGVASRLDFIRVADKLVQQDLLQRYQNYDGDIIYKLAPGIEKLAANDEAKTE